MAHLVLSISSLFALAAASPGFSTRDSGTSGDPPTKSYQQTIIAHAILCSMGFAVLLPIGALVARYLRTLSPVWYRIHWIAQFAVGGVLILVGCILGFAGGHKGGDEVGSTHKKTGVILLFLYLAQCALGAIIHWVKPKKMTVRPPQNYLHAVFGLAIIALSLYQIDTGIRTEWLQTGLAPLPAGIHRLWVFWCIALPLLYTVGLIFLRKQYRQEEAMRRERLAASDAYDMGVAAKLGGDENP